jgi:hypothetical protein
VVEHVPSPEKDSENVFDGDDVVELAISALNILIGRTAKEKALLTS